MEHQSAMEVENIEVGEASFSETVHFSGGIRGLPTNRGWALFPVSGDPSSNALLFGDCHSHLRFATQACRLRYVGSCVHYVIDPNSPPFDVWECGPRDAQNNMRAADSWGAVAHQAEAAGDAEYSKCARHVSVCLKVSELRLRDASNRYHDQLKWALRSAHKPGEWFSNAALLDLYADFHSLATEMASARDYLARLAAIHAGADGDIDSLARLERWITRQRNHASAAQPMVQLLLSELGTKERPGWLRKLGDIRNEMLHTLPMGANAGVSALTLQAVNTTYGQITSIRLGDPSSKAPLETQAPDPLVELSELSQNFEHLCRAAWKLARHPASLPCLYEKDAL